MNQNYLPSKYAALDFISRRQIVAKETIQQATVEEKKPKLGCSYVEVPVLSYLATSFKLMIILTEHFILL